MIKSYDTYPKNKHSDLLCAVDEAEKLLRAAGASDVRRVEPRLCRIIRPHLLRFKPELVLIFTVPYRVKENNTASNISEYAVPRDYHLFFKEMFEDIFSRLSERFPDVSVSGASDHSPIDEVRAAAAAGLGVIGKNHLLITPHHGSYVFIGELYLASKVSDKSTTSSEALAPDDVAYPRCIGCGACSKACPSPDACLSSLTQKKGMLSEEEKELIVKSGCAWGCDICQKACPMNNGAADTAVPFFLEKRKEKLTSEELETMSDDEFSSRAYAWRGRKTVLRNLKLLEESNAQPQIQNKG